MAKPSSTMIAASAICFLSLLRFAPCQDAEAPGHSAATVGGDGKLTVEGMVYCDNCHVQNITTISSMIPGAKVKLDCKGSGGTKSYEGLTDQYGDYNVEVDGGANEVCEISAVSSSDPKCTEMSPNSRISLNLNDNQGMVSAKRAADPISFMTKQPDPNCVEAFNKEKETS